jgi:hypothetical protein
MDAVEGADSVQSNLGCRIRLCKKHNRRIIGLWGVVWCTCWFELFYYDDIQLIDYVYYWMGFAAWGIRMLAWSKKRALQPAI